MIGVFSLDYIQYLRPDGRIKHQTFELVPIELKAYVDIYKSEGLQLEIEIIVAAFPMVSAELVSVSRPDWGAFKGILVPNDEDFPLRLTEMLMSVTKQDIVDWQADMEGAMYDDRATD